MQQRPSQHGYLSGGGLLFLVVAAVGLFSGYLYWLKSSSNGVEAAAKQALKPKSKVEQKVSKAKADDQFHFDFFSMLPEEEYIGIEERKMTPAKPKPQSKPKSREQNERPVSVAKAAKSAPTGNYLIQMGAFSKLDSAERHKAELILMGVENVQINTIQSAKGSLYRVNVGPFQSFSSAEHQQSKLKKAGYNSFLKKYKPSR